MLVVVLIPVGSIRASIWMLAAYGLAPRRIGCIRWHTSMAWTNFGHALAARTNRIHWAGTETSDIWYGYIEGAVRSGEREAHEVLQTLL